MIYLKRLRGKALNVFSEPEKSIIEFLENEIRRFSNAITASLDLGLDPDSSELPDLWEIPQLQNRGPMDLASDSWIEIKSDTEKAWNGVKKGWNATVDYVLPHFDDTEESRKKKEDIKKSIDTIENYSKKMTKLGITAGTEYAKRWWDCYTEGWDPYIGSGIISGIGWLTEKVSMFTIKTTTTTVKTWIETRSPEVIKRNKNFDQGAVQKYWQRQKIPMDDKEYKPGSNWYDELPDGDPLKEYYQKQKEKKEKERYELFTKTYIDWAVKNNKVQDPCEAAHEYRANTGNRWKNRLVKVGNFLNPMNLLRKIEL